MKERLIVEGLFRAVMGCYLGTAAVSDIRKGKVAVSGMLVCALLFVPLEAAGLALIQKEPAAQLTGAAFGALFVLLGYVTGEAIGYADGWSILLIGLYLGFRPVLFITCLSFILAAVFSGLLLCMKRAGKKTTFPFLPFLAFSYLFWCVMA